MKKITAAIVIGLTLPIGGTATALSASAAPTAAGSATFVPALFCRPWLQDCPEPPPPTPPNPCPDTTLSSATEVPGTGDWGSQHQHSTATLLHRRTKQPDGSCADTSAYVRLVTHTWTTLALQGFHATAIVGDGQAWGHGYRYGVDGTWIGTSDITIAKTFDVPLSVTYPGVTERLG